MTSQQSAKDAAIMPMSREYRWAIYSAIATIHFYRKDVIPLEEGETYESFAKKNQAVIDRVNEEILNLFSYELSHHQIGLAILGYTSPGQSVADHPAVTFASAREDEFHENVQLFAD